MKKLVFALALLIGATAMSSAQTIVSSDTFVNDLNAPKFRVVLQGGPGFLLGKTDKSLGSDMTQYQEDLKKGVNYGGEIDYFLYDCYTIGARYNIVKNKASIRGTISYTDGSYETGIVSDDSKITFIGPIFGVTTPAAGKKFVFILNIGFGYMGYEDKACVIDPFILKGSTVGMYTGLQLDYKITDNVAIGAEAALYSGTLSSVNRSINDGFSWNKVELEKGQGISVSHLDLSFGIRFYL